MSGILLAAAWPTSSAEAIPKGGRSAVATESEPASRAALRVLGAGGNAVDAAIAAAFVGGVTSPASSGLGGGGFALVYVAATREIASLDFRETAPQKVDVGALNRRPLPPEQRGHLVGVPGEVAGLAELHRRYGHTPWKDLVEPAVRVARQGYAVSPYLAGVFVEKRAILELDGALLSLFKRDGHLLSAGTQVKNAGLAATLDRVAQAGPRVLYEGAIAADLVASAAALGSPLSLDDLSGYRPAERQPLRVAWEGYDVYTMAPPSAGGLMIAEALGAFSRDDLRALGAGTPLYQHTLAELLRGALADRMRYLGDPDREHVDLDALLAPARLLERRRSISPDRTRKLPEFVSNEHGTHHIVTADAAGNFVSLTTTINHGFGAGVTARETSIVLNDELDDFTSCKSAHKFGIEQSPNRARPGARPLSSMSPTLVLKGGAPLLALGGSGGMTIGPGVTQALLALLAFDEPPERALKELRFEIPTNGHTIALEPNAPAELVHALEQRGEDPVLGQSVTTPAVQLIQVDANGRKTPFADPRKRGSALAQ